MEIFVPENDLAAMSRSRYLNGIFKKIFKK
jgi:hypothetical protein